MGTAMTPATRRAPARFASDESRVCSVDSTMSGSAQDSRERVSLMEDSREERVELVDANEDSSGDSSAASSPRALPRPSAAAAAVASLAQMAAEAAAVATAAAQPLARRSRGRSFTEMPAPPERVHRTSKRISTGPGFQFSYDSNTPVRPHLPSSQWREAGFVFEAPEIHIVVDAVADVDSAPSSDMDMDFPDERESFLRP